MAVKAGDKIKVEYEGRFPSGEVFDSSSKHGDLLEFTVGSGMVVKGFDSAVVGMEKGEEKEFTLKPEDAYGEVEPKGVQRVPKDKFPEGTEVGMTIGIPIPGGGTAPAKITAMDNEFVTLDLNHPLASKTLVFKLKVVDVNSDGS